LDTIETDFPSLFELLGRRWDVASPVVDIAFTLNSGCVAFLSGDGRFWQTSTADSESPNHRMHIAADTGRMTISRRRRPVSPLQPFALEDRVTCFAPLQSDRFAVGCDTGRLVSVVPTGRVALLAQEEHPVEAVQSAGPAQGLVASAGGTIRRYPTDGRAPQVIGSATGRISALASTSDGSAFAWLDNEGVRIGFDGTEADLRIPLPNDGDAGPVSTLAWNRRGDWLGVASGRRAISLVQIDDRSLRRTLSQEDYPAPVTELSWSGEGNLLATNGAFRAIVWDVSQKTDEPDGLRATTVTGRLRFFATSAIAFHPRKPMVAVGYGNGSIVVAQVDQPDELVVCDALAECATVMRWSADGNHLAIGTQGGMAAVLTFPSALFK
jgi:WD40 repeat protein